MSFGKYFLGLIFLSTAIIACKKNTLPEVEIPLSPTTGTRTEFTLDSIYLYAKQVYFWNEVLPAYAVFNPRKYTAISPELNAFKTLLFDVSQLKLNPATGLPYELVSNSSTSKYAYLEKGTTTAKIAATPIAPQAAVLKTAILSSGNDKIAYIALGSFPELNSCKDQLDQAFGQLSLASPSHIVIDLRSNGGGYVKTAEYVANLVIPSSLNGKVIYTEQYNATLQSGTASILKNQPYLDENGKPVIYKGRNATMADIDFTEAGNTYKFSKQGNMEGIKEVYFIVSSKTASASEMLISCFKPYFNIKLIGTKTYGKPVGFFGIDIDVYGVYLPSFLIKNAAGWSNYFNGMEVDVEAIPDGLHELGDPEETCLGKVIGLIQGKTTTSSSLKVSSQQKSTNKTAVSLAIQSSEKEIPTIGLLENRLKLKL